MEKNEVSNLDICKVAETDFQSLTTIEQINILSSLSQLKAETIVELLAKSIINTDISQELIDNVEIQKNIVSGINAIKGCKTINKENIAFGRSKLSELIDKGYIIPPELKIKLFSEDIFMKFYINGNDNEKYIDYKVIGIFTQQSWWKPYHTTTFINNYINPFLINDDNNSIIIFMNIFKDTKIFMPKILADIITNIVENKNTSKNILNTIFWSICSLKDEKLIKLVINNYKERKIVNINSIYEIYKYSWSISYIEFIGEELKKTDDETDIDIFFYIIKKYSINIEPSILEGLKTRYNEIAKKYSIAIKVE